MYGFWAHLEWDANDGRKELRLLLDMETSLAAIALHLGPWPLVEAVTRFCNEAARQAKLLGKGSLLRPADADKDLADQLHPLLAMILYLCSDEPNLDGPVGKTPPRPEPKRTKNGWRLFPPNKPTIWTIGMEIGEKLRRAKSNHNRTSSGKAPRAHIRRAHWHGYWTGTEDKKFKYNWLSPIFVSGRIDNEDDK